ncbi:MAG: HlyC/CorC family transporter [Alphaproteobacteria bacterium]
MIGAAAGIAVLLVLSAAFSGSQTALSAVSRARMQRLEKQGNGRARLVARLIEKRERVIGALSIGNHAVNILAASLATSLLIQLIGNWAIAVATIGLTLLLVVFAEVLPKTLALRHADRVALALAPSVTAVAYLLSPVASTVQRLVNAALRALGSRERPGDLEAADRKLRSAISLHAESGAAVAHERAMLASILDLDHVWVSEAMTHRRSMVTLSADLPAAALVERAMASPYTRIPIWRDEPDNIVGVIHAKDMLRALGAARGEAGAINVAAIMTPPWFVPETTTLAEQLNAFRARHAHFALVVDEYGGLEGLITLEDILEEIVGEISDEHDTATRLIAPQSDGSYLVQGGAPIRDVNRRLGWELSEEEATTIAGLMLHVAQTIPNVGDACEVDGFRFELTARQGNTLTQIRITPPPDVAARAG